ncbi:MAG: NAD(P)H-dependent oxidoreductase [Desulforhopalus sp.]|nr:NAD(P)H-dependent oxidoreductase [Desulforhopalus sp.]
MNKILLLLAHPAFGRSVANAALYSAVEGMEGVTCRDLYDLSPDFFINVKKEQELLLAHDIIIQQYPLYWYSTPSLLKEWTDLVFEHGWAYGSDGNALQGKYFMQAITTGSEAESYTLGGHSSMPLVSYLAPQRATARLCGMRWLPPFVAAGVHYESRAVLASEGQRYRRMLEALQQCSRLEELAEKYRITDGPVPEANALDRDLLQGELNG